MENDTVDFNETQSIFLKTIGLAENLSKTATKNVLNAYNKQELESCLKSIRIFFILSGCVAFHFFNSQ